MSDEKEQFEHPSSKAPGFSLLSLPGFLRQKCLETVGMLSPQELERRVEDGIGKALAVLNIPSREEVRGLQDRIEALIERCDLLINKKKGE